MKRTPVFLRHQAIRRASLIPPTFIRLHDIERAAFEPQLKRLPACEHATSGDRHRRTGPELDVIVHGIGDERFLEPVDVIMGQHIGSSRSPFVVAWPESIAGAGIHHQQVVAANRLAARS